MNWIKITHKDLECALNKAQLDILNAQSFKSAGNPIEEEIIASITAMIRAEICANELNLVDEDHAKIPPELKGAAVRLCVEALQIRIPSIEMTNYQLKQADEARKLLERAANGSLPISRPISGIRTANYRKSIKIVKKRNSLTNSESMKGL